MRKSGAIELSIGTIVIIVLAMSMLILGLVLVKNIFSGATNIVDLNNDQIAKEIAAVYGDDKRLVIYPNVDIFEVKVAESSAIGIRIKNLLTGANANDVDFSYEITLDSIDECGRSESQLLEWVRPTSANVGKIPTSREYIEKVLIDVPEGSPLCTFKVRVAAEQDGTIYESASIWLKIIG